ncbi:hypothetical protein VNO77_22197 [Canavalia gladiata]|uniref:J domain-containing protein n=1 Tax=Canavalia gladiata TaxID=3824 RepID=A0AAN9QAB5_CANGL
MDGHGGGNRAEAERWLYTANKLLSARDLHGARSFAIRARESDPTFDPTDLLLTVIDTLLAGENRINDHLDYYSILQVLRCTHNFEYIASQYRRLAVLLDPHNNPFAFAAHAFSLVNDAWFVLSNPSKKALYDNDLRLLTQPPPPPPPPPPPAPPVPPTFFPIQSPNHNLNPNLNQQPQTISPGSRDDRPVGEEERPSREDNASELTRPSETEGASFWTACPYCYVMYEYPKVYEECTLRCQSCRRGFHAVALRRPPVMNGKDDSFCSWGFFPLGFSGNFKDISGSSSNWNPFSPLVPCSLSGASNRRFQKGPWVFYDDDASAAFVEHSDTTDDDSNDEDWRNVNYTGKKRKKRRRRRRRKSSAVAGGVEIRRSPIDRPRRGIHNSTAGNGNVVNGEAVDAASVVPNNVAGPESSKKAVIGSSRRRGERSLEKLDLNVEFSNEVEEHAPGMSGGKDTGNAEDNIEGIGFFEGLDEFLSSLPILNVVADDKVKGQN